MITLFRRQPIKHCDGVSHFNVLRIGSLTDSDFNSRSAFDCSRQPCLCEQSTLLSGRFFRVTWRLEDGRDFGRVMIEEGLARAYPKYPFGLPVYHPLQVRCRVRQPQPYPDRRCRAHGSRRG